MSEELVEKKPRKGTKSCTECRRRKIRCVWSSEDAKVCRRCEERGSECTAQTFTALASDARRLTSRQKIHQLESKVAHLSKAVHNIEVKLGAQPAQTTGSATHPLSGSVVDDSVVDDYDDDSSASDVLGEDRPTLLSALFQNEWLSVDLQRRNEQLQDRKARTSAHLLDTAKQALQKLIPSKEDVESIAINGYASRWLVLVHTLFPQPFMVKTHQEMVSSYDDMQAPKVEPMALASWLLAVALTAVQVPQEKGSPGAQLNLFQRASYFARAIAETVEKMILSHDRLIGTIQGLSLALLCGRFQIFQGNFRKGWLQLRRGIAIAELLGLPQNFQAVQFEATNGLPEDHPKLQKAEIWESICALDRITGTVLNLPTGTKRYQDQVKPQPLVVNGVVQPRVYLFRLADIALRTQYVDDLNMFKGGGAQLYNLVLDLDRELRTLTAQTPKEWWTTDMDKVDARHVIQFWQKYVTMRVHLPFTLHRDPSEEYLYSRLTGMEACRSIAKQYKTLRRALPSTFFLCRFGDLQAFTATVVLLLALHSNPASTRLNMQADRTEIETIVSEVIELMEEKSGDFFFSNFARHGATTILALSNLLRQDDASSSAEELTLKVPLLGTLHVRRNRATKMDEVNMQPQPSQPDSNSWNSNAYIPTPQDPHAQYTSVSALGARTVAGSQIQADFPWDPLSWSIENNHEDIFQDAMMAENFDDFAMLHSNESNFLN